MTVRPVINPSGGLTRRTAEALDAADPLGGYRNRFVIDDDALIYLDGNSLGRLPKSTHDRVHEVLREDWGNFLIRSWSDRWLDLPARIGDLIGTSMLGSGPDEVILGDSTTVALYKVLWACLEARPGRRTVIIESGNFPTDRYVVEALANARSLDVRELDSPGTDFLSAEQVAAALDESVAAVVLSHVDYRTGALLEMGRVTSTVHEAGALMVWDLCHSVGVVPIDLTADGVDAAVGCTYKYLNGGPGAPAFTYVRQDLQQALKSPIWGWWSGRDMFAMAPRYEACEGIRAWLTGTPPVLSMAAVEPGVAMVAEAGVAAIRVKSVQLTELAIRLYDELLQQADFGLATPRDPGRRGSHITVTHDEAQTLTEKLMTEGVIADFRGPDGIRIGLSPLTTRYTDVFDGISRLARLAAAD